MNLRDIDEQLESAQNILEDVNGLFDQLVPSGIVPDERPAIINAIVVIGFIRGRLEPTSTSATRNGPPA
jgi:hypothetical protein